MAGQMEPALSIWREIRIRTILVLALFDKFDDLHLAERVKSVNQGKSSESPVHPTDFEVFHHQVAKGIPLLL